MKIPDEINGLEEISLLYSLQTNRYYETKSYCSRLELLIEKLLLYNSNPILGNEYKEIKESYKKWEDATNEALYNRTTYL